MVDELGKGQAVAQAVVTPQETYDPSRTPLVVSLFKPDGTPFLADTATVFSTLVLVVQNLTNTAFGVLTNGEYPIPYPTNIVLINQEDESRNGIYQAQMGAPGTTGLQPMKKTSDLPAGDAMIGSVYIIGDTNGSGNVDAANVNALSALVKEGGFIVGSVDTAAGRMWGTLYDADRLDSLESRVEALEP